MMEIYICTDNDPRSSDWFGGMVIFSLNSSNTTFSTYNGDSGSIEFIDKDVPLVGVLNVGGNNTFKLIKRGNNLRFNINGIKVGMTMEIIGNTTDINIPHLYNTWYDTVSPVTYKSVEVKFWGDQFLVI